MNNPLGVSPSKGNQGTTRGKEKIFWPRWESNSRPPKLILCFTICVLSAMRHNIHSTNMVLENAYVQDTIFHEHDLYVAHLFISESCWLGTLRSEVFVSLMVIYTSVQPSGAEEGGVAEERMRRAHVSSHSPLGWPQLNFQRKSDCPKSSKPAKLFFAPLNVRVMSGDNNSPCYYSNPSRCVMSVRV